MPDYTNLKATTQYLEKYAEPEIRSIPVTRNYEHVLVIPAFDEHWNDLQRVWRDLAGDFLVILVINSSERHAKTLGLQEEIHNDASRVTKGQDGRCTYLTGNTLTGNTLTGNPDLLVVDRCTPGNYIDARQGVGLARKIGADIALRLHADGKLKQGRISVTDADAILPSDYFDREPGEGEAALVFPFRHIPETTSGHELSMLLYEISILYYAAGLSWAGSHYGFTTLGSCMAINPRHYAEVRGYPKRSAAEDFYLLNKLAKTGQIARVPSNPILLSGRLSERVPVGTGPGIRKISILENPIELYKFYHPGTFQILNEFLILLSNYWDDAEVIKHSRKEIQHYWAQYNVGEVFTKQRSGLRQKQVFDKFVLDWFDALRTLKFIHFMRQHYLPSVPLSVMGEAPFIEKALFKKTLPENLPALRDLLSHRLFG